MLYLRILLQLDTKGHTSLFLMLTQDNCSLLTLPFSHITNVELYQTLETVENHIKTCLDQTNFPKYINSFLPANPLLEKPCKYYTCEEFYHLNKNKRKPNSTDLNLLHHNIRRLDLHFGELIALITSLGNNFDFIALSEIGNCRLANRESDLKNHGYNLVYESPHSGLPTAKGGVGLIYKDNIELTEREDLKIESKIINPICKNGKLILENIWYETKFPQKKDNYIIAVIYKHPGCSEECIDHFSKQIENNMIKINKENKKCIITGDINIDGLKITKNSHIDNFFRTVLQQSFIPTITKPTRIYEGNTSLQISLIDHIFISPETIKNGTSITSGNIYSDITDHLPNFITIKTPKFEKNDRPTVRIYGEKNMAKFKELLAQANWDEFYAAQNENIALGIFYKTFNDIFNKAFPMKKLSRKRSKDKKWITTEIKACIHIKNELYKKYILNPISDNKTPYNKYKNWLARELSRAENQYYKDLITSENQNLYKLWTIFGKIINPKKNKKKNSINKLIHNNKTIIDDVEMANTLNEHFCTIGEKLAQNFTSDGKQYRQYLNNENNHTFSLHSTDKNEVLAEINKLNPKKSSGHDNLSPSLIKECSDLFSDLFTHIINLSFQNARVPDKLKTAKVIPLHKKNEKFNPENYRPISLLSTMNKIMERLMHRRLISFLEKFKILYAYQFGFRKKHSTSLALIDIIDNILEDLESGNYVAGLFIDFSKAFDTVNHEILADKLHHYGIRGHALDWFRSYLCDRNQFTVVNGKSSNLKSIKCGVPQGSVLGPLLFLIYTNDIANCTKQTNKTRLFADDTGMFLSRDNPTSLRYSLKTILSDLQLWCHRNKLTINLIKTCYIVFKTMHQIIPESLNNIKLDNVLIQKVSSNKYLGVTLDENLNWDEHIDSLNKCLAKTSNSFKIIKKRVHEENKIVLFNAYILSKVQYGIEVYGKANATSLKKVQVQQNKSLKILFNKDPLISTKILHQELNTLLVKDIYNLSIAKFVFKYKHSMLPDIFDNVLTENSKIHQHNTRQSKNMHVTHKANRYGEKKTSHQGSSIWNSLPNDIKNSKTIKNFSKKLKKLMIQSY